MPDLAIVTSANNEINEVMGSTPSWMFRYGSLLLLLTVILLLSLSVIIRYPDVIEGRVEIRPAGSSYLVTATLPVYGTGRIRPGQQVYIKMDKYPREEFGELPGTVVSIPEQRSTGEATLRIALTAGMKSTRGYLLDPGGWASGHCSIVTGRERLLAKLLPLKNK